MHALGRLIVTLSAGWVALKATLILVRARHATRAPVRDIDDPDWL